MQASETHFGFTNMGPEMLSFRERANWKSKFWFGSPCISDFRRGLKLCPYLSCLLPKDKFSVLVYYDKFSTIQLGSWRYILRPKYSNSALVSEKLEVCNIPLVVKHQQKSWFNSFISNMFLNVLYQAIHCELTL